MKSKGCKQGPSEPSRFGRNNEVLETREVEDAQHRQQQEEQRSDPGEAQQIKVANADPGERTPAPQGRRSNEKTRDRKENLNAHLTVPDERRYQLVWQALGIWHMRPSQPHVDVIHQHEEDGESAKQIDPVESSPRAGRVHRTR